MKTRSKFIVGIVVLLAVFFVLEYQMPRKFEWTPTFAHNDAQPFGCLVFDSVLKASMPNGYTVERRTLWQMEKDSVFTEPKAVLIVTEEDIDQQIKTVFELASKGNVVMLAITDLSRWCDTLGIDFSYHSGFNVQAIAGKPMAKGMLRWEDDSCRWSLYPQLVERTLKCPDSVEHTVLARFSFYSEKELAEMVADDNFEWTNAWQPVAVSFPMGEGELILVSAPLLLTNYMMVSGNGSKFIGRLMTRVKHLPVIRTESYMKITATKQQSPFYVMLQEPPLRWALYLAMLTVLLFCIFTARRRQRVIPVITKPKNGNLEFVSLIGTLYWQQHDNAVLLAKKLTYFTEEIRRQAGIDITQPETLHQLATLSGRDPEELRLLLSNIRQAASGNYTVSDPELKTYIDELDQLLHSL